jgi:hypothetical protein
VSHEVRHAKIGLNFEISPFILMSWAIKRRDPIYPPMFNSLAMIPTVVMDSVLLRTNIFLGKRILCRSIPVVEWLTTC